jgi:hypothetical protein
MIENSSLYGSVSQIVVHSGLQAVSEERALQKFY